MVDLNGRQCEIQELWSRKDKTGRKTYWMRLHVLQGWPVDAKIPKKLYEEIKFWRSLR